MLNIISGNLYHDVKDDFIALYQALQHDVKDEGEYALQMKELQGKVQELNIVTQDHSVSSDMLVVACLPEDSEL